jgi:hypothetical protein
VTRRHAWILLCAVWPLLAGCFTLGHTSEGNPIAWDAVEKIQVGTHTMRETLDLLGAPLEYHRHPDGTLLVYRARYYDYWRLGLEPDFILTFTAADRLSAGVLENLRLVVESGAEFEERVAVYFDREGVVAGVGTHRKPAE